MSVQPEKSVKHSRFIPLGQCADLGGIRIVEPTKAAALRPGIQMMPLQGLIFQVAVSCSGPVQRRVAL